MLDVTMVKFNQTCSAEFMQQLFSMMVVCQNNYQYEVDTLLLNKLYAHNYVLL